MSDEKEITPVKIDPKIKKLERERNLLQVRVEELQNEVDDYKNRIDKLAPPLPIALWERSKNVWEAALHSHLFGKKGDPGPMAIIERALFDAEKNGPSGRKDPYNVHCNGECSCKGNKNNDSKKKKADRSKKKRTKKDATKNKK